MTPSSDVSNKAWLCKCCPKFQNNSRLKRMNTEERKNDHNMSFKSTISTKSVDDLNPFKDSNNGVTFDYSKKTKIRKPKKFSFFCPKYYNCVDVREMYGGSALEEGKNMDKRLFWFLFPNKSKLLPFTNNTVISKNTPESYKNWGNPKNFDLECKENPKDFPISVADQSVTQNNRGLKTEFLCNFSQPEGTKISLPQHTNQVGDSCITNFTANFGLNSPQRNDLKEETNEFLPRSGFPPPKYGFNNTNLQDNSMLYNYQQNSGVNNNSKRDVYYINKAKQAQVEYDKNSTNLDTKIEDIVFKECIPDELKNKDIFNENNACEFSEVFRNDGSAFGRFALFSKLCEKYNTINKKFPLKRIMKKKTIRLKNKLKLKWLAHYIVDELKKKNIIESSVSEDLKKSIKVFFSKRFDSEKSSDEIINQTSPEKGFVKCSCCGHDKSQSNCWNFILRNSSFSSTNSKSRSKQITNTSGTSKEFNNERTMIGNINKQFVDAAVNHDPFIIPTADKAVTAFFSNDVLKIDQYIDTHDIDRDDINIQKYNQREFNIKNIKRNCYKETGFTNVEECCLEENERIKKLYKEQIGATETKTRSTVKKIYSLNDLLQNRGKNKRVPLFFKHLVENEHNNFNDRVTSKRKNDVHVLFRCKSQSSGASSKSDSGNSFLFRNKLNESSYYIFITKAADRDSKKWFKKNNNIIIIRNNSYSSLNNIHENYSVESNYEENKRPLSECRKEGCFREKYADGSGRLKGCQGINLKRIRKVIASDSSDRSRYIIYRDIVPDELNHLDLFNSEESPPKESSPNNRVQENYRNGENVKNPCYNGSQDFRSDFGHGRYNRKDGPPKPLPFMEELNEFWKQRKYRLRSYPQLITGDSNSQKEDIPENYRTVPCGYSSGMEHNCRFNYDGVDDSAIMIGAHNMNSEFNDRWIPFVGPRRFSTPSKRMVSPAAPSCTRCGEEVFAAERIISCGGCFHKNCYVCCMCRRPLSISIVRELQGEVICEYCFSKNFGAGYILK